MSNKMSNKATSFRKIDYTVRPAKNVERKMLVEAFRKLEHFHNLEEYHYVGFGSVYFSDFSLFHRELNFQKMYSIEDVTSSAEKEGVNVELFKRRLQANMPYSCVELIPLNSSLALSQGYFDYTNPTIFWLDYDYHINNQIISDIETVIFNIESGSILLVTLDARKYPEDDEDQLNHLNSYDNFKKNVSKHAALITKKDVNSDKKAPNAYWSIINQAIVHNLEERNLHLPEGKKLCYHQIFHFNYADKALMTTIGGIFYSATDSYKFERCNFNNLNFYRNSNKPFKIEVPKLTFKEFFELGKQLPYSNPQQEPISYPGLREDDIKNFQQIYRYIPRFGEFVY